MSLASQLTLRPLLIGREYLTIYVCVSLRCLDGYVSYRLRLITSYTVFFSLPNML